MQQQPFTFITNILIAEIMNGDNWKVSLPSQEEFAAWIFMSFYANPSVFKKTIKYASAFLTLLLIGLYILIDIVSLKVVTKTLQDQYLAQLFTKSEVVPMIHLFITSFFIPIMVHV
jgi:hypothetical protein